MTTGIPLDRDFLQFRLSGIYPPNTCSSAAPIFFIPRTLNIANPRNPVVEEIYSMWLYHWTFIGFWRSPILVAMAGILEARVILEAEILTDLVSYFLLIFL